MSKWLQTLILSLFLVNSAAAEVLLQSLQGEKIPFSSLEGKWVLINYWASWCSICLDEIPTLNAFYEQNKDKNLQLFAVNYDALPVEEQKQLVRQLDIRFPSLKQDPSDVLKLGYISVVPVTFVFNPEGKLSQVLYGEQNMESLSKAIKTA